MDKEKGRGLKRRGNAGGRSSPAKRRQRALSGRRSRSTKPTSPPSSEKVAVLNGSSYDGGRGGGGGDESAMERWKKERAKAFWGSGINKEDDRMGGGGGGEGSDGGEPHLSRPPLPTSLRLESKVSEDCDAVDPALVPRKLRSAMNKRGKLSACPDSKNKCHASNGNNMPCVNGARRSKKNMLKEPVTKEEEDAAETLSALATLIPGSGPIEIAQDGRMLENSETTAAAAISHSASKEESTKFLLPSTGSEATNPSSHKEESSVETAKPEPSVLEQPALTGGNQKLDPGSNGTAQPEFQKTPPSKNEEAKNTVSRDSLISSNLPEASLYTNSGNKSAQTDALFVCKSGINLWPFGSSSAENHVQPFKQKTNNPTHYMRGEGTSHALQPGLPSTGGKGYLTMSSSTKAAVWPDSAASGCRTSSNGLRSKGSILPTGKLPQVSADRRLPWKRCTTHVHISHVIQSYQNTENKRLILLNQSKAKEGVNSGVQASDAATGISNLNSMTSAGTSSSIMESTYEARIRMSSGSYMQQQQGPYHSSMQFPFSHGPYTSQCPDQLAASTQQLPHHMVNSIYAPYGPQMALAGGTAKHQQQIWQAHMGQYRPPLGVPTWQTMRLQDPSLLPCAQPPSSFPQLSRGMQGRSCQSPNSQQLQQFLPTPSSLSSSKAKKPHGGGFGTEGAPPVQLLCNAKHM